MCRYAISGPYKRHYACFACRKAFKQPPIEEWLEVRGRGYQYEELIRISCHRQSLERRETEFGVRLADLQAEYDAAAHRCPECGEPMGDLGLDFKPPRQVDVKAWRILQGMFHIGHAFHTCGCHGPGFIPKAKRDYRRYLEEHRKSYLEQFACVRQSTTLAPEEMQAACACWRERIARLDAELAALA